MFVFALLSVVSHLQFIILYLGLLLPKIVGEYLKRAKRILETLKIKIRSELLSHA